MFSFFNRALSRVFFYGMIAILITAGSLWYSNRLVTRLSASEEDRIKQYAESLQFLGDVSHINDDCEVTFVFSNLSRTNKLIPTILADSAGNISGAMNLGISPKQPKEDSVQYAKDSIEHVKKYYQTLKEKNSPPPLIIDNFGRKVFIYYDESDLLKRLRLFPYLVLVVIIVFISIVFLGFFSAKRSEQNKVWVGLAKETAHQLGTPVSSLMAWVELLKLRNEGKEEDELIIELEKDVERLKIISERFSKIGSQPELQEIPFEEVLERSAGYVRKRMSKNVELLIDNKVVQGTMIKINPSLFDWVIENLLKNALDAIQGPGKITICAEETSNEFHLDIMDTGKGMPKHLFTQVFKPGFTTKKRGWGLGLSLTKRIIENYHKGKIFVKSSEVNKGTTFRIMLPK